MIPDETPAENLFHPEAMALVTAFYHPVDLSELPIAWIRDTNCLRLLGDIQVWKSAGKPADPIIFDSEYHNGFFELQLDRQHIVRPEHWDFYLGVLKEKYQEMRAYDLADRAPLATPAELIEQIFKFRSDMEAMDTKRKSYDGMKEKVHDYIETLEARRDQTEAELLTGFQKIDDRLWGLNRGEILTIGARTGVGKSVFCMNVTGNLLKAGKRVLYFSTEMTTNEKLSRLLSIYTGIDAWKFRRARFAVDDWGQIMAQSEKLAEENNFFVCDDPSPDIGKVRAIAEKVKPDVVVLDYLSLFRHPKSDRKDLEIGEFMVGVKVMARNMNLSAIVVSQLNRGVDNRTLQIPTLADLKESGNIEQESDVVLLLHDQEEELKAAPVRNVVARICKNRHGQCGMVVIKFLAEKLQMMEDEGPVPVGAQKERYP